MTQFPANIDLSSLDRRTGAKLRGVAADNFSGISVASAGDVNGDSFADVIVGAHLADPHGLASGPSYVVSGKAPGFGPRVDLSSLDSVNGFKLSGVAAGYTTGTKNSPLAARPRAISPTQMLWPTPLTSDYLSEQLF